MPTIEIKRQKGDFVTFKYSGRVHVTNLCSDCPLYREGCTGVSKTGGNQAIIDISNTRVDRFIKSKTADVDCGVLPELRKSSK
ncbi:hypothetical protein KKD37_04140 [Patescibacteria group bacterium]|nr:hypothetical protein [Patescibacteria group bacterium]